jgi:hypothetical protein
VICEQHVEPRYGSFFSPCTAALYASLGMKDIKVKSITGVVHVPVSPKSVDRQDPLGLMAGHIFDM